MSSLAHVMVVGGTRRDWHRLDADTWRRRVAELAGVVADAGAAWLTIRMYEDGPSDGSDERGTDGRLDRWHLALDDRDCVVVVDPAGDGRERFAEALRRLPPTTPIDEKAVTLALYEPADVEPDLVLVLGPPDRLPPSLVWELAYGELVFLPIEFHALGPEHVVAALEDFQTRRRRFGGLDP